MNKKAILYLSGGVILLVAAFFVKSTKKPALEYIHNAGETQGTYYSATYLQPEGRDLQVDIEKKLHEFDLSLSTYNPNSIISQINRNVDTVKTDAYFDEMYQMARDVSERTNGAFDITVAPLVNAWGFGFGKHDRSKAPDQTKILPYVGYQKIRLEDSKLIKTDPKVMLDASALAQGLSADIIARLLEKNGCTQYMVEIGGEVMCKGLNPKGEKWRIGIDKPIDDPTNASKEFQIIASITNVAINTSGNYRQFYYRDGQKYAHEIDPRTGSPVTHNLLSATVVAPNCMMADAYATAFMILGVDSAMIVCKSIPDMDCYLIYSDSTGKNKVIYTEGFKKYILK